MILKRFIICLGVIFIAAACNELKGPEKPKNLISKEKMVDIILDSKLVGLASSKNKKIMKDHGIDIDTYVFKKHNIDSLQFALSNSYYAFHIKEYDTIYGKVMDSLEKLQAKYKDLEAKEWKEKTKQKEDSLQSILKDTVIDIKKTMKEAGILIKPISVSDKEFQSQ